MNLRRNETAKVDRSWTPAQIRSLFPMFKGEKPCAYLDNAATSQKPAVVTQAVKDFYDNSNANVHRGVYQLSEEATALFEGSRRQVAEFLGAESPEEVLFTSGTTGGINLVAFGWGLRHLKPDDEILVSVSEHHSNLVPWQMVAEKTGAKIKAIPLNEHHRFDLEAALDLINNRTKVLAVAHVSNVLGVIHPVETLIKAAKEVGALTVIDGAQGVPHLKIDVNALDCDFYAFSAHKMAGPTGIGGLYGKSERLEEMDPVEGGGDMIAQVGIEKSTWNTIPYRFEAGTPNIAGAVGLGAAVSFLENLDREQLLEHDKRLATRVYDELKARPQVKLFGSPGPDWVGVVTFWHEWIHPHDMAALADGDGVAIRAGHHCAQPLMSALGVPATSRVSPWIYNNDKDIDRFLQTLEKAEKLFRQ